jgi:hypothetical protein
VVVAHVMESSRMYAPGDKPARTHFPSVFTKLRKQNQFLSASTAPLPNPKCTHRQRWKKRDICCCCHLLVVGFSLACPLHPLQRVLRCTPDALPMPTAARTNTHASIATPPPMLLWGGGFGSSVSYMSPAGLLSITRARESSRVFASVTKSRRSPCAPTGSVRARRPYQGQLPRR